MGSIAVAADLDFEGQSMLHFVLQSQTEAQTTRDARRQFNLNPPWITVFMGAVILVGYGALWISVCSIR
ncbi:MAG: hypothetical protein ABSH51_27645 [Solirubrobacteraceae bacterium]|jgi:hypothetical protein